jgi:hypothetical protein
MFQTNSKTIITHIGFDLEKLRADECEFIFTSRHQSAGHTQDINIESLKYFEKLLKIKIDSMTKLKAD